MKKFSFTSFLPFVSAVVWISLIQWTFQVPTLTYRLAVILILFNLLASYIITGKGKLGSWFNFSLLPIGIVISMTPYLVISNVPWMMQLVAWGAMILLYLYWRFVYFYLYIPGRYTAFSLENISFYGNFLVIFALGSAALGLKLLLALNGFMVTGLVGLVLAMIIYQSFWVSKYSFKDSWALCLGSWLVLLESFFALTLLPNDYQLLAFIWSTIYYLVVTVISDFFNKQLNSFKIKAYLILTGVSWLLLFATAVWI